MPQAWLGVVSSDRPQPGQDGWAENVELYDPSQTIQGFTWRDSQTYRKERGHLMGAPLPNGCKSNWWVDQVRQSRKNSAQIDPQIPQNRNPSVCSASNEILFEDRPSTQSRLSVGRQNAWKEWAIPHIRTRLRLRKNLVLGVVFPQAQESRTQRKQILLILVYGASIWDHAPYLLHQSGIWQMDPMWVRVGHPL